MMLSMELTLMLEARFKFNCHIKCSIFGSSGFLRCYTNIACRQLWLERDGFSGIHCVLNCFVGLVSDSSVLNSDCLYLSTDDNGVHLKSFNNYSDSDNTCNDTNHSK